MLGDGAAWIWTLAAEHFPRTTCIVDWYHASERVWALGRALHGEGATVRDEQVTYFTNQAPRMAYAQYWAAGWDIGSGMVGAPAGT